MHVLYAFWLPILVSSIFVFAASSVIHMALQAWHRSDYRQVPEEGKLMDAVRPFQIPPGDYMIPNCSDHAQMKTPEFKLKLQQGPVMIFTVLPTGMMAVGKNLFLWFVYLIVVSWFAAFAAAHSLPAYPARPLIWRLVGVTSLLAYSAALWQMSIWYGRSWATTLKTTIDGLIYAAITAATFGWLWPR
jgi:hypothetical protein